MKYSYQKTILVALLFGYCNMVAARSVVEVTSAEYGSNTLSLKSPHGAYFMDVTEFVVNSVNKKQLTDAKFKVHNANFGGKDPKPGVFKILRVSYRCIDNKTKEVISEYETEAQENITMHLTCSQAPPPFQVNPHYFEEFLGKYRLVAVVPGFMVGATVSGAIVTLPLWGYVACGVAGSVAAPLTLPAAGKYVDSGCALGYLPKNLAKTCMIL